MSQPRYRIQAVSQITGVPAATLRAWERRYGFPEPERTASSYRLYSEADIESIKQLKSLCSRGLSPSEAVKILKKRDADTQSIIPIGDSKIDHGAHSKALHKRSYADPTGSDDHDEEPFIKIREQLLNAVYQFDPLALERGVRHAMLLGSAKKVFDGIFAPVLHRVGADWHEGKLSIAQEHLVTEALGNATRDLLRIVQPDSDAKQIILACVAGELHSIPLYGSALHFIQWGYRVVILGVNTPPEALAQSVAQLSPAAIGLSVTYPPSLEATRALIPAYIEACQGRPLIVGGASAGLLRVEIERGGGLVATGNPSVVRTQFESMLSER